MENGPGRIRIHNSMCRLVKLFMLHRSTLFIATTIQITFHNSVGVSYAQEAPTEIILQSATITLQTGSNFGA
jgi:hypothetical protein